MSYLVLARKWRPAQFDELLGQQHVSQTLTNAIKQDRIAHAFLFCGPRGVGKTSAARILAKTLMCPEAKTQKSCNQCSTCKEIAAGTAVDVMEIDGASNNGVDSIRELREKAHYLPSKGKLKVYIIDEVHMLSQSAFNALLKILEEPPPHLKFIFATTELHKIPATILSRCQRFDFRRIPLTALLSHLEMISKKEKIEIEKDALLKIAREARGSFRDALSLLDQVSSYANNKITLAKLQDVLGSTRDDIIFKLLGAIFSKESQKTFETLFNIYEDGQDIKQLATELLEHIRHILIIKIILSDTASKQSFEFLNLTAHELKTLTSLAEQVEQPQIEQALHLMLKGTQEMSFTKYPQFILEMTLIKLLHVRDVVSIDTLLANLGTSPTERLTPTPVTTPTSTAPKSTEWKDIVAFIRTKKPSLSAVLEHGHPINISSDKITLGFPKSSVFFKMMSEADNKAAFERLSSECTGNSVTLQLSEITAASDVQKSTIVEENEKKIDALKKKALAHKTVQEAQKILEGKILDVQVEKQTRDRK